MKNPILCHSSRERGSPRLFHCQSGKLGFESQIELSMNHFKEARENMAHFIFCFHQINPSDSCAIIQKLDQVSVPTRTGSRKRTPNICKHTSNRNATMMGTHFQSNKYDDSWQHCSHRKAVSETVENKEGKRKERGFSFSTSFWAPTVS